MQHLKTGTRWLIFECSVSGLYSDGVCGQLLQTHFSPDNEIICELVVIFVGNHINVAFYCICEVNVNTN